MNKSLNIDLALVSVAFGHSRGSIADYLLICSYLLTDIHGSFTYAQLCGLSGYSYPCLFNHFKSLKAYHTIRKPQRRFTGKGWYPDNIKLNEQGKKKVERLIKQHKKTAKALLNGELEHEYIPQQTLENRKNKINPF